MLATVLNYDHLYLGGGNSRRIKFKLPGNVSIVSNDAGMEGSAFVWLQIRPKRRLAGTHSLPVIEPDWIVANFASF